MQSRQSPPPHDRAQRRDGRIDRAIHAARAARSALERSGIATTLER